MRLLGSLCALVAFAVVPSLGGPALRPPRLALRAPYPPLARARCGARMGAGGTSGAERSARKGARGGGGVTPATQPASSQAPMRELFTPGFEAPLGGQVDTRTLNAALNFAGLAVVVLAVVVKLLTVDAEISRGWTWFEIVSRLPSDNWSDYTSFLTASPVLTKAITSGTVYALGDILAQSTEGKGLADLDRVRTVRSSLCGFTLHGPLSHLWYIFAERLFDLLHWGAWYFVPLKILTDQARASRLPGPRPSPRATRRPREAELLKPGPRARLLAPLSLSRARATVDVGRVVERPLHCSDRPNVWPGTADDPGRDQGDGLPADPRRAQAVVPRTHDHVRRRADREPTSLGRPRRDPVGRHPLNHRVCLQAGARVERRRVTLLTFTALQICLFAHDAQTQIHCHISAAGVHRVTLSLAPFVTPRHRARPLGPGPPVSVVSP